MSYMFKGIAQNNVGTLFFFLTFTHFLRLPQPPNPNLQQPPILCIYKDSK